MSKPKRFFHFAPAQAITLSFAVMCFVGALLLTLPVASRNGQSVGFLNALFTATSAGCVTGLVVVETLAHWSLFGHIVIILLIQFGGLGFISIMTFSMVALRKRISLRSLITIQAAFNQDSSGGMIRLVKGVVRITAFFEGVGAILLALVFYAGGMQPMQAVGKGIFHAVSAFCNAGFDLIGPHSLGPYATHFAVNAIIMVLIIAGGLGFTVWGELIFAVKNPKKRSLCFRLRHLSLHSKMALLLTGIFIVLGALLFLLLEWRNPATLGPMSLPQKLLAATFQSVTLRTAGFATIDQSALTEFSIFMACLWMLVGGSPAGTAGGMKTVTLGVVLAAMFSALRGKARTEAFGRTLPLELLQKALTVICTLLLVVFTATFILYFSEQNNPFEHTVLDLLFETCSAAGTVGLTTGITPHLSAVGKGVIALCMFLGRLSPVTLVAALHMKMRGNPNNITYLSENVIIG